MEKLGIELKWAAIISSFMILWAFIEKSLGWHEHFNNMLLSWGLFYLLFLVFYTLAFLNKKKKIFKNSWSIKEAFKFGLLLSGLLAILNPLVQYIIYNSISVNYFENLIQYKLASAFNHKTLEQLQMEFSFSAYVRNGIFDVLSFGVLYSILLAYLLKTKEYVAPKIIQKNNTKNKNKR